jgi:hypothetical protein
MSEEKEKGKTLQQTLREAWMGVLGVFTSAESEMHKKLLESLGMPPDANLATELLARVRKNREEFERRVDEGVKAAVARVRAPIDKELAALKTRVEQLQEKVEERRRKRAAAKEAPKPNGE